MITRRPVNSVMVERVARALYEEDSARRPWDGAAPWMRDPFYMRAVTLLEIALPADAEFLRDFAHECQTVAEIL